MIDDSRALRKGGVLIPTLSDDNAAGWRAAWMDLAARYNSLSAVSERTPALELGPDERLANAPYGSGKRIVGIVIDSDKFRYMHEAIDWLRSLLRTDGAAVSMGAPINECKQCGGTGKELRPISHNPNIADPRTCVVCGGTGKDSK